MQQARPRRRLAGRIRPGAALIASNCIGGRLSGLAGAPYRSPTVGLWFWPGEFLEFAGDLPRYLALDLREDPAATPRPGGADSLVVPAYAGAACVGDLYSEYHRMTPVLTAARIGRLFG